MRIVIDMQGAQTGSRFRGIGRYTLSLTRAIARNRGGHEIILVLNGLFPETIEPIRAAFDGLLQQENIRVWHAAGPVREIDPANNVRRETAERIREAFLAELRADWALVTSLFEGLGDDAVTSIGILDTHAPVAVILYDLIPLISPDIHFRSSSAHQKHYARKISYLKRSRRLLAISESARREAIDILSFDGRDIVNIPGACDASFQVLNLPDTEKRKICSRAGINRPFIMHIGTADERKNLPRLIKAYAKLPPALRKAHQLVLGGRMPEIDVDRLQAEAKSAGLRNNELCLTGYVSDDELVRLYNLCKLFVLPSWHEGFGLPALEAMSCGAAVIGANASSLPEVIGRQDALFDQYDEKAISQKMAEILGNDSFRRELAAHGLEQAKKFSWDESAKRAIASLEGKGNVSE